MVPSASLYAAQAPPSPPRQRLREALRADIAIVGGGYTGLSAALHLAKAGARAAVLEAQQCGFAASGRNGGQVHSGYNIAQDELEALFGVERAHRLWDIAENAKALVRETILSNGIPCALRMGTLFAAHDKTAVDLLTRRTEHLHAHYSYSKARMLPRDGAAAVIGSSVYFGAMEDTGGGHLDPLAFARGLASAAEAAGARIFENSRVLSFAPCDGGIVLRLSDADVTADRVILACDAFMPSLIPSFASHLVDIESYLIATAPLPAGTGILRGGHAVADTRNALDYFRMSNDGRLVFAGGETVLRRARDIVDLVRPRMLRVFPQLRDVRIDFSWSGTVAVTRSRLPHFGRRGPRVLFGYGYSGHGVALATQGGKVLAEAALGRSDDFELLASLPAKAFPGGAHLRKPFAAAWLAAMRLRDAL